MQVKKHQNQCIYPMLFTILHTCYKCISHWLLWYYLRLLLLREDQASKQNATKISPPQPFVKKKDDLLSIPPKLMGPPESRGPGIDFSLTDLLRHNTIKCKLVFPFIIALECDASHVLIHIYSSKIGWVSCKPTLMFNKVNCIKSTGAMRQYPANGKNPKTPKYSWKVRHSPEAAAFSRSFNGRVRTATNTDPQWSRIQPLETLEALLRLICFPLWVCACCIFEIIWAICRNQWMIERDSNHPKWWSASLDGWVALLEDL